MYNLIKNARVILYFFKFVFCLCFFMLFLSQLTRKNFSAVLFPYSMTELAWSIFSLSLSNVKRKCKFSPGEKTYGVYFSPYITSHQRTRLSTLNVDSHLASTKHIHMSIYAVSSAIFKTTKIHYLSRSIVFS